MVRYIREVVNQREEKQASEFIFANPALTNASFPPGVSDSPASNHGSTSSARAFSLGFFDEESDASFFANCAKMKPLSLTELRRNDDVDVSETSPVEFFK